MTTTEPKRKSRDGDLPTERSQPENQLFDLQEKIKTNSNNAQLRNEPPNVQVYQKKIIYLERRNKMYEKHLKLMKKQMSQLILYLKQNVGEKTEGSSGAKDLLTSPYLDLKGN